MFKYSYHFLKILKSNVHICLFVCIGFSSLFYVLYSGNELRYGDEYLYYRYAQNILDYGAYVDNDLSPLIQRPPGYSALLAVVMFLVSNEVFILKLVNVLALLLSAWFCYKLVGLNSGFYKSLAKKVVLLFILCYPVFVYTSSTLYPQIVSSAIFLGILFFLYKGKGTPRSIIFSSLFYAGLVFMVPSFLFLFFIFIPLIWIKGKRHLRSRKKQIINVIMFSLVFGMVILPWTVRNYILFNKIIPISANSGLVLLLGNSKNSHPNGGPTNDISEYLQKLPKGNNIAENDQALRNMAIKWILDNPTEALFHYVKKVIVHFGYSNNLATKKEESIWKDIVMVLSYYPLLILLVVRLFLCRKYPLSDFEKLALIIYFANALFSSIFFPRIRYRIPYDFLLIMIASTSASLLFFIIKAHIKGSKVRNQHY